MRIFKRPNGIWYVSLPGNKRRSLGTTVEREAQAKLKQVEKQILQNKLVKLEKDKVVLLKDFIKLYTEDDRQDLSRHSLKADRVALKKLTDVVGADCPMHLIDTEKILLFKTTNIQKGIKHGAVNAYLMRIRAALHYAADKDMIKDIPKCKMLKVPKRLPRILTIEEITLVLENADTEMQRIIKFALWTGCRLSEIIGLRWDMIRGGIAFVVGKGNKERAVPLVGGAIEAVGTCTDTSEYVFAQYHPDTISHMFKDIARDCDIPDIHFHSLRHSAATQMVSCGLRLDSIQKILGHTTIRVTQMYAQVVDQLLQAEMSQLKY